MDWYVRFDLMREKSILQEFGDNFAGIVVDAHIIETYADATANFLSTLNKPFIIDPVTFKFSTYNSVQLFSSKRWYPRLFGAYYDDIIRLPEQIRLQDRSEDDVEISESSGYPAMRIEPTHLSDNKILKSYVKRVISYQRNRIANLIGGLEIFEENLSPVFPSKLIPPYAVMLNSKNDEWLPKNIQCIKEAVQLKQGDEKIFPVIAIYKDLIHHDDSIAKLVNQYNIEGVDGYFVWVTDFKEEREDEQCLLNYIKFFNKLKEMNKPIINFYGGYLSMIAASKGIVNGWTAGIGYAEYRNPFSEGGPVPAQYYYNPFHTTVPRDEVGTINTICEQQKCNCAQCQQHEDLIQMGLMDSLHHLIHTRIDEIQYLRSHNLNDIIQEIQRTIELMDRVDADRSLISHYRHLSRWQSALSASNS